MSKSAQVVAVVLALLAVAGVIAKPALAQEIGLVPAQPDEALNGRVPLIAIHGWRGSQVDTWEHDKGFADFWRRTSALNQRFKLFFYNWPTCLLCDHTPGIALALAADLRREIRADFGPDQQIAILAHSFGGLIARSFMQELGQHVRTSVLITLATLHHGTLVANLDFGEVDLSGMYWDRYDNNPEPQNDWLRCLNGIEPDNGFCTGGDVSTRTQTFAKIVAIGVARPISLSQRYPNDTVVPIQSALFDDASPGIRARYRGTAGQVPGSMCPGNFVAHSATHYDDCQVQQEPATGLGPEDVFAVVERELLGGPPIPGFAFAMKELEAYTGGQTILRSFSDTFQDGSLDSPPTSSFFFSSPVEEEGGGLRFRSGDGFASGPDLIVDAAVLTLPITDGTGNATVRASFRADVPPPGRWYGIGMTNSGPSIREEVWLFVATGHDGTTWVLVGDQSGILAGDRVSLLDPIPNPNSIWLRLVVNDATDEVEASYGLGFGIYLKSASQFEFFVRHGTIFQTGPEALVWAFGGASR